MRSRGTIGVGTETWAGNNRAVSTPKLERTQRQRNFQNLEEERVV
jgi:hypothetical protein